MSKNSSGNTSGGVGATSLLQIAFIVLKLCNVIDWKWVWVLSPMWIGASIVVITLIVLFLIQACVTRKSRKNI